MVLSGMFFKTFLSPRFKKAMGILQSPPSIMLSPHKPLDKIQPNLVCELLTYCNCLRPSRYLLLKPWMKSNQIWCVSCSHEWVCNSTIFWVPVPCGLGEGPKGQISFNTQLQSQFQIFLNQTLCVFSQMKDIKHIRKDFHSVA